MPIIGRMAQSCAIEGTEKGDDLGAISVIWGNGDERRRLKESGF